MMVVVLLHYLLLLFWAKRINRKWYELRALSMRHSSVVSASSSFPGDGKAAVETSSITISLSTHQQNPASRTADDAHAVTYEEPKHELPKPSTFPVSAPPSPPETSTSQVIDHDSLQR